MTTNEAREILAARYPGRSIKCGAESWINWGSFGPARRTVFCATIFYPGIGYGVARQVDAPTLEGVLAQLPGIDTDIDANADAEVCVTEEQA